MAYSAVPSFGNMPKDGFHKTNRIASAVEDLASLVGYLPATASTRIAPAGGTTTIYVSSGTLRTITTVAIATGMTIAIGSAGAVQGMRFTIAKTATAGTGAVTIDGKASTTHKKFNAELMFVNGAWRLISHYEYA